ncbi:hypothetical protein M885DRAFT_541862 [Pelagophyceae sp. CCMP2097]|nr:hypothetical protein M885DRAFT_541862 [Pelagophyceae sp. CCMP2097]
MPPPDGGDFTGGADHGLDDDVPEFSQTQVCTPHVPPGEADDDGDDDADANGAPGGYTSGETDIVDARAPEDVDDDDGVWDDAGQTALDRACEPFDDGAGETQHVDAFDAAMSDDDASDDDNAASEGAADRDGAGTGVTAGAGSTAAGVGSAAADSGTLLDDPATLRDDGSPLRDVGSPDDDEPETQIDPTQLYRDDGAAAPMEGVAPSPTPTPGFAQAPTQAGVTQEPTPGVTQGPTQAFPCDQPAFGAPHDDAAHDDAAASGFADVREDRWQNLTDTCQNADSDDDTNQETPFAGYGASGGDAAEASSSDEAPESAGAPHGSGGTPLPASSAPARMGETLDPSSSPPLAEPRAAPDGAEPRDGSEPVDGAEPRAGAEHGPDGGGEAVAAPTDHGLEPAVDAAAEDDDGEAVAAAHTPADNSEPAVDAAVTKDDEGDAEDKDDDGDCAATEPSETQTPGDEFDTPRQDDAAPRSPQLQDAAPRSPQPQDAVPQADAAPLRIPARRAFSLQDASQVSSLHPSPESDDEDCSRSDDGACVRVRDVDGGRVARVVRFGAASEFDAEELCDDLERCASALENDEPLEARRHRVFHWLAYVFDGKCHVVRVIDDEGGEGVEETAGPESLAESLQETCRSQASAGLSEPLPIWMVSSLTAQRTFEVSLVIAAREFVITFVARLGPQDCDACARTPGRKPAAARRYVKATAGERRAGETAFLQSQSQLPTAAPATAAHEFSAFESSNTEFSGAVSVSRHGAPSPAMHKRATPHASPFEKRRESCSEGVDVLPTDKWIEPRDHHREDSLGCFALPAPRVADDAYADSDQDSPDRDRRTDAFYDDGAVDEAPADMVVDDAAPRADRAASPAAKLFEEDEDNVEECGDGWIRTGDRHASRKWNASSESNGDGKAPKAAKAAPSKAASAAAAAEPPPPERPPQARPVAHPDDEDDAPRPKRLRKSKRRPAVEEEDEEEAPLAPAPAPLALAPAPVRVAAADHRREAPREPRPSSERQDRRPSEGQDRPSTERQDRPSTEGQHRRPSSEGRDRPSTERRGRPSEGRSESELERTLSSQLAEVRAELDGVRRKCDGLEAAVRRKPPSGEEDSDDAEFINDSARRLAKFAEQLLCADIVAGCKEILDRGALRSEGNAPPRRSDAHAPPKRRRADDADDAYDDDEVEDDDDEYYDDAPQLPTGRRASNGAPSKEHRASIPPQRVSAGRPRDEVLSKKRVVRSDDEDAPIKSAPIATSPIAAHKGPRSPRRRGSLASGDPSPKRARPSGGRDVFAFDEFSQPNPAAALAVDADAACDADADDDDDAFDADTLEPAPVASKRTRAFDAAPRATRSSRAPEKTQRLLEGRLKQLGWSFKRGTELVDWIWVRPGKGTSAKYKDGFDYFSDNEALWAHAEKHDLWATDGKSSDGDPPAPAGKSAVQRPPAPQKPLTVHKAPQKPETRRARGSAAEPMRKAKAPQTDARRSQPDVDFDAVWPGLVAAGWTFRWAAQKSEAARLGAPALWLPPGAMPGTAVVGHNAFDTKEAVLAYLQEVCHFGGAAPPSESTFARVANEAATFFPEFAASVRNGDFATVPEARLEYARLRQQQQTTLDAATYCLAKGREKRTPRPTRRNK